MGIVLLVIDWQLALFAILAALPMYFLLARYTRQLRTLSRMERQREGALASVLHETLGALRLNLLFDQSGRARERFREESQASVDSGYAATMAGARFGWTTDIIRSVVTATILAFGVQRVMSGAMSLGDLLIYYSYVRNFYGPIRSTIKQYDTINRVLARAERVVELLDAEEGVTDLPGARRAPPFRGQVEFKGVTFGYDPGRIVLQDTSMLIPASARRRSLP